MSIAPLNVLTEEELDVLVSIAIRRAEFLDDVSSPSAGDAWHEVMLYEEQLSAITKPMDVPGGIARVGAVSAALAAGRRSDADKLAEGYLSDAQLPEERRLAISRALKEDEEEFNKHYPLLAKRGLLNELRNWRQSVASMSRVFPLAA